MNISRRGGIRLSTFVQPKFVGYNSRWKIEQTKVLVSRTWKSRE